MFKRILLFIAINFAALAIGSLYTNIAVAGEWYTNLNKAPWTPPGYMFGIVWTFIMVCFGFYIATLYPRVQNKKALIILFVIQWVLNVGWNPIFFYYEQAILGLISISLLTGIIIYFLFKYFKISKSISLLIAPYLIWLLIATSLNAYIVFMN